MSKPTVEQLRQAIHCCTAEIIDYDETCGKCPFCQDQTEGKTVTKVDTNCIDRLLLALAEYLPDGTTPIYRPDETLIRTTVMEGPDKFKAVYYTPTCKFGYCDCIYDDAYIKTTYPEWWEDLQKREGIKACDQCIDSCNYDNEDK